MGEEIFKRSRKLTSLISRLEVTVYSHYTYLLPSIRDDFEGTLTMSILVTFLIAVIKKDLKKLIE